jgi:hypothetical protein
VNAVSGYAAGFVESGLVESSPLTVMIEPQSHASRVLPDRGNSCATLPDQYPTGG